MARIAFITPSLSPHHGIGDYARLLAVQCVHLGHSVQMHALNEPETSEYITEVIRVDEKTIQVYRWGQHLDYALKCRETRRLLELFEPDWVSLQFEFYCYAYKGSLWGLIRYLPAVLRGYQVHLIVLELWVRFNSGKDWLEQLKGVIRYLQCWYLIKKINPICAHTSVWPYAKELKHMLPDIKLLPIPSNIQVDRETSITLPKEISETMSESGERPKYLLAILFGRIVQEWEVGDSLKLIDELSERTSRYVRLISIGENGYNDLYWKRLVDQMPSGWRSVKLGARDPKFISQTLQCCDLAISSTPFSISRKSTTTAAFLEHGLPVLFAEKRPPQEEIATAYPSLFRDQFYFADQPLPLEILTNKHRLSAESHSLLMARQFMDDLLSTTEKNARTTIRPPSS